jgi:HlyD family secretion protein
MNDVLGRPTTIAGQIGGGPGATKRRPSHLQLWIAAIVLIGLVAVTIGLWRLSAKTSVHYIVATVTKGTISQTVAATGTVNPVLTIIVGAQDSGVIQQLFCDYNARVRVGQICAKIDPRPFQAALNQYSGQLRRDQAQLDESRMDLARYQSLLPKGAVARQLAEDQEHLVQQQEGTVKLDQALVDTAKLNLLYTNITSPVDGIVVSRAVTQGQTVASSFQTPTLFLVATDLKTMEVDANISESDAAGVRVGDKAIFTVDAFPNRTFHGVVAQLRQSPQTVQNVVTYDAVISVDNTDLALMPGMTASSQIITNERHNILRIPDQALRYSPSGQARTANETNRAWVLKDGKPVSVIIATGLNDGNFIEVTKGNLGAGDQVIVGESQSQSSAPTGLRMPRL